MIKLVSIIIPVFNEVDAIEKLVENTQNLRHLGLNLEYEIIIVDDGSTDGTGATLKEIQQKNKNLRVVSLVRNYGQSTALQAGFDHSTGDVLITMDGDLQNDPADIPKIIDVLKNNHEIDLVAGWRKDRQDSVLNRKLPSMFANYLISYTTGIKSVSYTHLTLPTKRIV